MPSLTRAEKAIETLKKWAVDYEREDMLNVAEPSLKRLLSNPKIEHAYLGGSFPTSKPSPSDIDIFAEGKGYLEDALKRRGEAEKTLKTEPSLIDALSKSEDIYPESGTYIHGVPFEGVEKDILLNEGKKRYGENYDWAKLFGIGAGATAGISLSDLIEGETNFLKVKNAEAGVLNPLNPNIRSFYNQLKDIGHFPLFRILFSPEQTERQLKRGAEVLYKPEKLRTEFFKPTGTYFTEDASKTYDLAVGEHLTPSGKYPFNLKELIPGPQIIRALQHKNTALTVMQEDTLLRTFRNFIQDEFPEIYKKYELNSISSLNYHDSLYSFSRVLPSKFFENTLKDMSAIKTAWNSYLGDSLKIDALKLTDMKIPSGESEVIILNPEKVSMFWNNLSHIPGGTEKWLTGAFLTMGLASLQEKEAEAMPLGNLKKITQLLASKSIESSARDILKGVQIRDKIIEDVWKSKQGGQWRQLIFEDGTALPITKDYLESLIRAVGTKIYIDAFSRLKSPTLQKNQALNSALMRAEQRGPESFKDYQSYVKSHFEKIKEIDPTLVPEASYVDFQDNLFFMPQKYSDLLEGLKELKIKSGVGVKPTKTLKGKETFK